MTQRLSIVSKNRQHEMAVVEPGDFTTAPVGEIDPIQVLNDPAFTLYCFDTEQKQVLFVESSNPQALDKAPFYYIAQVEHAVGLVSMPESTFHQIAQTIRKPRSGFIFVHSVGRCGSTLLSKVLGGIPEVHSLSEPDDLTQMVLLRTAAQVSDDWLRRAALSSTLWRAKPRKGQPADFVAIKTRSEVTSLGDILSAALPQAKTFFLYRNALSWIKTIFRSEKDEWVMDDEALNRRMEAGWGREVPLIQDFVRPEASLTPVQIRTICWISAMESYLRLVETGAPVAAARFEDLTTRPRQVLSPFFEFCGINNVDWEALDEILGTDSQAGSRYAREKRYERTFLPGDDLLQQVGDLLALRPLLNRPDVVLPGTVGLDTVSNASD